MNSGFSPSAQQPSPPANPLHRSADGAIEPAVDEALRVAAGLVRRALPVLRQNLPSALQAMAGDAAMRSGAPIRFAGDRSSDQQPAAEATTHQWFSEEELMAESELSSAALNALWTGAQALPDAEALAETVLGYGAQADSEAEALAFAGGLSLTLSWRAPPPVLRVLPVIVRGSCRLVHSLYRSPRTRPLLPVVGCIARGALRDLSRRAQAGHSVTAARAAASLAGRAASTFRNPRLLAGALARNFIVRKRLNRRAIARAEG